MQAFTPGHATVSIHQYMPMSHGDKWVILLCLLCGGLQACQIDLSVVPLARPEKAEPSPTGSRRDGSIVDANEADSSPLMRPDGGEADAEGGMDSGSPIQGPDGGDPRDASLDGSTPSPDGALDGVDAEAGSGENDGWSLQLVGPNTVVEDSCTSFELRRAAWAEDVADFVSFVGEGILFEVYSEPGCQADTASAFDLQFEQGERAKTIYIKAPRIEYGLRSEAGTIAVEGSYLRAEDWLEVRRAAVNVLAGAGFMCALLTDHTIECWGRAAHGALGRAVPDRTHSLLYPANAELLARTESIPSVFASGGGSFACLVDGSDLRCWGDNRKGQLGVEGPDSAAPVASLSGVTSAAVGAEHVCALKEGGVYCWGDNAYGQLGRAVGDSAAVPALVDAEALQSGVAEVALGAHHSCALKDDGTVWCWGAGMYQTLKPIDFGVDNIAKRVFAGQRSACAVLSITDQLPSLHCWGEAITEQGEIRRVTLPSDLTIADVVIGAKGLCIQYESEVYCGGDVDAGFLGADATWQDPVKVDLPPGHVDAVAIGAGPGSSHAAIVEGLVYTWGWNGDGEAGRTFDPAAELTCTVNSELVMSREDDGPTCSGTTPQMCWGKGGHGLLAAGTDSTFSDEYVEYPVARPNLGRKIAISADWMATFANKKLLAWGLNNGAINDGLGVDIGPTEVPGTPAESILSLSTGRAHGCAVFVGTQNGRVFCWGDDSAGQLGDPDLHPQPMTTAVQVGHPAAHYRSVEALGNSTCALVDDGVQCWGELFGSTTPVNITGLEPGLSSHPKVTSLAMRTGQACATKQGDGTVCWGADRIPIAISGLPPLTLRGTTSHICGWDVDGAVYCWGENGSGQLGDTAGARSEEPVLVNFGGKVSWAAVGGSDAQGTTCACVGGLTRCIGSWTGRQAGGAPFYTRAPSLIWTWEQ